MISDEIRDIIEDMLYEFLDNKCTKELAPSDRNSSGRYVVYTGFSPEWYSAMCRDFPRPVQPSNPVVKVGCTRTIVKRAHIIYVMNTLLDNGKSASKYAPYIIGEAQSRLESYNVPKSEIKKVPY